MSTDSTKGARAEMTVAGLKDDFARHIRYTQVKDGEKVTRMDEYTAFAHCVRDRLIDRWLATVNTYVDRNVKRVYYMSLEFLIGRLLGNNVINLGMDKLAGEALAEYGIDWNALRESEADAGLGNGGLGRLAACFLDSLSTLDIPAMGYGIRYDYGIFKQKIVDGQQIEEPDAWLKNGCPWELCRPEYTREVHFGGRTVCEETPNGQKWCWVDTATVLGVPYDYPVVGYGGKTVNTLRLWSARATDEFRLEEFNRGSYVEAVEHKVLAENLTKVLYPNDNTPAGKELRLRQQYFFVCCSVQDILNRFRAGGNLEWEKLPEKAFIQLNETHPALVIPELMRVFIDEEGLEWDRAWSIVRACTGYTNHTVLPEALEKWPVHLLETLLPRHMQIIYEINAQFLKQVASMWPGDIDRLSRMSIIEEGGARAVRMANLAIIGSSAVNGVAALHSEILKDSLFHDFYEMYPSHFSNKTNGITQRRWLLKANPRLASLITSKIGESWIVGLDDLRKLEAFADDPEFLQAFRQVKRANKEALARYVKETLGIEISPDSIFDVQVKRLHEYKRQLLLVLYIIVLYNRFMKDPTFDMQPRTFIFAAKAAPGYAMAKLIIRLIHAVGEMVNNSKQVNGRIKVVFLPDYRVSLAERIIPAADVSEQISLAGTEASGTGNMKLMLNGALTVGTLDGANVEIREEVGDENIFIFGLHADEVAKTRPSYNSRAVSEADPEIAAALKLIRDNVFCPMNPGTFDPIVQTLLDYNDYYMLLADLRAYIEVQDRVQALYRDEAAWTRASLMNTARAGKFSSDRTIREYVRDIWHVDACRVE